jgi:membrane-associated HD superfamily phosphohydrolase
MTTLATNHFNESEMQKAILKSLHKARLVKEEKAKQEKKTKIKPIKINKDRFIINHAQNIDAKDIETILNKHGCIGKYEKRHARVGIIVTKNVSQDLLKTLNSQLLNYGISVKPYYKKKRNTSKRRQKKLKKIEPKVVTIE